MRIHGDISKLIGNTPMVWLNKVGAGFGAHLAAKLEFLNPGGSIKDRIALAMIEDAEKKKLIKKNAVIIESTSGNTGVGLALVAAQRGYRLMLTMPEGMTAERSKLLSLFGAEIVFTPAEKGIKGAIEKAREIFENTENAFMPQQFKNPANPEAHRKTTAEEIWRDTDGKADILVCGVGTGGTITGVAEGIKEKKPGFKVVAVEPEKSAVLSGGKPGTHGIHGIGAGFIPEVLRRDLIDEVIRVSDEDAISATKKLRLEEGILAGISSGAALWAGFEMAKRKENEEKLIVLILPDTGERYLSIL